MSFMDSKEAAALDFEPERNWASMTDQEKKEHLYQKQKRILNSFLERGAITPEQYEKSLGDLSVKMGFPR